LQQVVTVQAEYYPAIQETSMAIPYALSLAVLPAVERDAVSTALDAAQRYLNMTAKSGELADIEVETQVLLGTPASEILAAAQSLQADLIVMCSHGYTGFKRWRLGSVTERILGATRLPLLIVRPQKAIVIREETENNATKLPLLVVCQREKET
jgi:nucleotide-binding universal stress UspA family protein